MFFMDADQAITQADILAELRKPPTPAVSTVDLSETTFRSLHSTSSEIAAIDLQTAEASPESSVYDTDQYIRATLLSIAEDLDDPALKSRYSAADISTKELIDVLNYASSDELLAFTSTLVSLSTTSPDIHNFVVDKIDNALHFFNVFEKRDLMNLMLDSENQQNTPGIVTHIFRSCEDVDEVRDLVEGVGQRRLLAIGDTQILEYVAQAVVGQEVQAVILPERLDHRIKPEQIEETLNDIETALKEIIKISEKHTEFEDTQTVKDYILTARDDLKNLAVERSEQSVTAPVEPESIRMTEPPAVPEAPSEEELAANPDAGEEYTAMLEAYESALADYEGNQSEWLQYDQALEQHKIDTVKSLSALREIANVYSAAIKVELRYGVNITYAETAEFNFAQFLFGDQETTPGSREGRWSEQDIEDIETVLEAIPEGHLVTSPLLREIQRVSSLGGSVFAARFKDGVVKVAEHTIDSDYIRNAYEGRSPLVMVLVHELGHSIQIGNGPSWIKTDDDGNQFIEIGERKYDFDEFMALSGWEAIAPERWEGGGWMPLTLDGEEVEVGTPIEHNGERIVLVPMGWDSLIKYNADANFSHDPYSHASPWEDFAEAFTEYIFLPERLIKHAPDKFQYLELEFRKYENNHRIQDLIEQALKDGPSDDEHPGHAHHH